ncbi:MAG: hypothetical protein WBO47_10120 [Gammaproteobacteria bacterium]
MKRLSEQVRLILIHGMARKPPEQAWLALWRTCLLENLQVQDPALGRRLADDPELLVSAYWADAVPDHLAELPARVRGLKQSVAALVALRREYKAALHVPAAGLTMAQYRDFAPHIIEALHAALVFGPSIRTGHGWELDRYHRDSGVADRIRRPLEQRLRECWDQGRRVVILAHSLGGAVAYDALWRFAHRPEPEFRNYRKHKVDLLVTMGVPLAEPYVQEIMLSGRALANRAAPLVGQRRQAWLGNLRRWHNYAALGDIVCQDLDMEAQFFAGMRRDLGPYRERDLRDYRGLFNAYREPEGGPNPHKAFGYLNQPKLAQQLSRLLRQLDRD